MGSPPNAAFSFDHLLTREAAHKALLGSNRRALHGAAADVLAQRLVPGSPDEIPLLQRMIAHLEIAGRWDEAHRRSCTVLSRSASLGLIRGWEALAEHAAHVWLRASEADPALPERSVGLENCWSFYCALTGRLAEAQARGELALEMARAQGDAPQTAAALVNCGIAHHFEGQEAPALDCYQEARTLYRELGDHYGELRCLNNIGLGLHESGHSVEALPYLTQGLALAKEAGGQLMQTNLSANLGIVLVDLEQYEVARDCFVSALEMSRAIGDISTEGMALGNLGELAGRAGELDAARAYFAEALTLAREIESPRFIALWTLRQAELEHQTGDLNAAERLNQLAQERAEVAGERGIFIRALIDAARLELDRGHPGEARRLFDAAAAGSEELGPNGVAQFERLTADLQERLDAATDDSDK